MRGLSATGAVAGALALLAFAPSAMGLTRAEYIGQADAICQAANQKLKPRMRQTKKVFHKHRGEGESRREERVVIRALGRLYRFYGNSLISTAAQLRTLAAPPEDVAGISGWLDGREQAGGLFLRAARAGRRGNLKRLFVSLVGASEVQQESEKLVEGYGFRRCVAPTKGPKL